MAATVLNGNTGSGGSLTWTNNTGGNVRVIVNYFGSTDSQVATDRGIQLSIGTATVSAPYAVAMGKNLGMHSGFFGTSQASSNPGYAAASWSNLVLAPGYTTYQSAIPVEFYIAASSSFTLSRITGTNPFHYNILVIPENG